MKKLLATLLVSVLSFQSVNGDNTPIGFYVYHGEDCAMPKKGYESTDWFPANYRPVIVPIWNVKEANEKQLSLTTKWENVVYAKDISNEEMLQLMAYSLLYTYDAFAMDDGLYYECMSL